MNREGRIGKVEGKTKIRVRSLFPIPYSLFLATLVALALPSCQPTREAAKPPVRLGADVQQLATEMLGSLGAPVTIQINRGGAGEEKGEETQALVDLLASVSSKVSVKRLDIASRTDKADLGVPRGPVIEMLGQAPGILRYYGYPERKEIRPFLEGVLSASGQPADLPSAVNAFFKDLDEKVWIRIFTTPD